MKTKELKLIVLCLCLFAKFSLSFSQTNNISNVNEYPIDDPRNPNCPCHQHQKLAEQQYLSNINFMIQKNININKDNEIKFNQEQKQNNPKESVFFALTRDGNKFRNESSRKAKIKKNMFVKFFYSRKHGGRVKKQRAVNNCFSWV
ncbi:MAG: hypothetical protein ACK5D5_06655 [Bacteroidota bacterium]|jgi:hypothetical protein